MLAANSFAGGGGLFTLNQLASSKASRVDPATEHRLPLERHSIAAPSEAGTGMSNGAKRPLLSSALNPVQRRLGYQVTLFVANCRLHVQTESNGSVVAATQRPTDRPMTMIIIMQQRPRLCSSLL